MESPNAKAERPEPIPYRPETRQHADRGDRNELVELARCRPRAWRRASAVEEARGRREYVAQPIASLARGSRENRTEDRTHCSCLRDWPGRFLAGTLAAGTRHRGARYPCIERSRIARASAGEDRPSLHRALKRGFLRWPRRGREHSQE